MEYWNVGLNKELMHFIASLPRRILTIDQYPIFPKPIIPWPRPYRQDLYDVAYSFCRITLDKFYKSSRRAGHHSAIPTFQL